MVVADDEQPGRARRPDRGTRLVDEGEQQLVRRPSTGVPDDEPRRDPFTAHPAVGSAVEHELDADRRRDDRPETPDERRLRRGTRLARERMQQVRAIDEQALGAGQRVAREARHHAIVRVVGCPATIGAVSLLLLVDLDGVVYRGSDPVPGVAAVLADRAARGDDVVYVTNNSMHYRADYVTRLAAMGAPITADTVVSSARATALHIANHETGVKRVLVVGAGGLERELRDVGLEVVTAGHAATRMHQEGIDGWAAAGAPDAVVSGLDPNLTYLRLAAASDCIRAGARFIATNRDPVYPTERGLRPGAGSIAAALEASSGVTPLSIGKPAPHLLELAAEAVGRHASEAIMIGDGIGTDLAAARAVGAHCVFMLTGVTTRDQVEGLPGSEHPTAIAADAAQLAAALEELAG